MSQQDPFDRLRAADPVAGRALPDAGDDTARTMRDGIMTAGTPARLAPRRWIAVGAGAAAVLATAAAIVVATRPVEQPMSVGCYAGPSTTSDTTVLAATGDSPVDQCRRLWESGDMDPGVSGVDQVPPLVACVLDSGVVGVFPAGSCDDVDTSGAPYEGTSTSPKPNPTDEPVTPDVSLPPSEVPTSELAMPDYRTSDETIRAALEEIRQRLLDRCVRIDTAIEIARDALAGHGLEGWTVAAVDDDHDPDACAGFFPDAPDRAVRFFADQPQPGQTPEG